MAAKNKSVLEDVNRLGLQIQCLAEMNQILADTVSSGMESLEHLMEEEPTGIVEIALQPLKSSIRHIKELQAELVARSIQILEIVQAKGVLE